MSSAPRVRYAKSEGGAVAYQAVGNESLDLVFLPEWMNNLEMQWDDPRVARFPTRLSMFSRVLMLNMRGIGLSDPLPEDERPRLSSGWTTSPLSSTRWARSVPRCSERGSAAVSPWFFAATYPERTSALVLLNSTACSSAAPDYPFSIDREWRERTQRAMRQAWGQAAVLQLQEPELAADDRFRDWYVRFERYGASPGMALAVLKMVHDLDVRHVLPAIFSTDNPDESPPECPDTVGAPHPRAGDALIDPVIEYANHHQPGGLGATVIGGHVYRGQALPQFSGRYVFGDWSREFEEPDGSVFVAKSRKTGLWHMEQLRIATSPTGRVGHYVLGFGQDLAGEMYLLTTD